MFACHTTIIVNYGNYCTPDHPWKEGSHTFLTSGLINVYGSRIPHAYRDHSVQAVQHGPGPVSLQTHIHHANHDHNVHLGQQQQLLQGF